jgi:hypothetical protein
MIRFAVFAAAAIVSMAIATPALAQAAIQEPGMYAFYHPNGDLGLGSARPADAMASEPLRSSGNLARLRSATMSHPLPARRAASIKRY